MIPEVILTNWMTAITLLLQNYRQLIDVLSSTLELHASKEPIGISQCPLRELLELVNIFESELEGLLLDMDKPVNEGESALPEHYQRIIDHTQRLDQLNRQAQIRLQLTCQSAS